MSSAPSHDRPITWTGSSRTNIYLSEEWLTTKISLFSAGARRGVAAALVEDDVPASIIAAHPCVRVDGMRRRRAANLLVFSSMTYAADQMTDLFGF